MSAQTFTTIRQQLKTLAEATPGLPGLAVVIQRNGADIDAAVENALAAKGLALVIMATDSGVNTQTRDGGSAKVHATVPLCLIEDVAVNMAEGGHQVTSEDALLMLLKAIIGKPAGDGEVTLGQEVFARGEDGAGVVETYLAVHAPLIIRRS